MATDVGGGEGARAAEGGCKDVRLGIVNYGSADLDYGRKHFSIQIL